ncbi:MAG: DUF2851 family protein [Candidatus Kapaibacterium sp.]
MRALEAVPERVLQRAVRRLLSHPGEVHTTVCGKRLQVLAPGRVNVHEGPDFLDMALHLEGHVVVGAGEFHRRSSDWMAHDHDASELFADVVLHIVMEHDVSSTEGCVPRRNIPVLVVTACAVAASLQGLPIDTVAEETDEVHAYALVRLLRLTAEHRDMLAERTVDEVVPMSVRRFLHRFAQKRHRPQADAYRTAGILEKLPRSPHLRFVASLARGEMHRVHEALRTLLRTGIAAEGEHLRREILLNCLIPCSLAVARDEARIGIFEWYWSLEALSAYGSLSRMFRGSSQRFVWQQQGLLEMARERAKDLRMHEPRTRYDGYGCPRDAAGKRGRS